MKACECGEFPAGCPFDGTEVTTNPRSTMCLGELKRLVPVVTFCYYGRGEVPNSPSTGLLNFLDQDEEPLSGGANIPLEEDDPE